MCLLEGSIDCPLVIPGDLEPWLFVMGFHGVFNGINMRLIWDIIINNGTMEFFIFPNSWDDHPI